MKKNILFNILWLLLAACHGGGQQPEATSPNPSYRTTAPSLLFFRNMRSSFYEQTEQPGTRIELYRLRKFNRLKPAPVLVPVIANNWLEDEAYLLLEQGGANNRLASPITIKWLSEGDTGVYRLERPTAEGQYKLALELNESIQAGHQLQALAPDSTWAPIFEGSDIRSYFTTTARDYLRLTEAL